MSNAIENLRQAAATETGADLAGYAAVAALNTLFVNWEDALSDGSKDKLLDDIDDVVNRLRVFRSRAAEELPVQNGGLDGKAALLAQELRHQHQATVYYTGEPAGQWSFTGACGPVQNFDSFALALAAAVQHYQVKVPQ